MEERGAVGYWYPGEEAVMLVPGGLQSVLHQVGTLAQLPPARLIPHPRTEITSVSVHRAPTFSLGSGRCLNVPRGATTQRLERGAASI